MHVKKEKAIWNHHQIYFSYYYFCYCKSGLGDTGIILGLVRVFPKEYKQTKQGSTGQLTFPPCKHINTHVYSLPLNTELRDWLYCFLNLVLMKYTVLF